MVAGLEMTKDMGFDENERRAVYRAIRGAQRCAPRFSSGADA